MPVVAPANSISLSSTVSLRSPFALAPMAGLTDVPFRTLAWELGAGYMVSEMVTSKAELWETSKSRLRRMLVPGVNPNTIPRYLNTKNYNPKKTIPTISNAMDVSNPSNFIRIEEIFQDFNELKNCFSSYSFNDDKTLKAVKSVYKNSNYILDPHGAVGYLGLKKFLANKTDFIGVFLETAHPIKFSNHIENELNLKLKIPHSISKILNKEKVFTDVSTYSELKKILIINQMKN